MKGTIEQIWENESRMGQKYLTVLIDGERYSIWDTKYFDLLRDGTEIEYDVRQSGNYKHLTDIKPVEEQQNFPSYQPNNKDKHIARMSCLKSASEILAPIHLDVDAKRDLVVETAKYFERYVFEDDVGSLTHQEKGEKSAGNG